MRRVIRNVTRPSGSALEPWRCRTCRFNRLEPDSYPPQRWCTNRESLHWGNDIAVVDGGCMEWVLKEKR